MAHWGNEVGSPGGERDTHDSGLGDLRDGGILGYR